MSGIGWFWVLSVVSLLGSGSSAQAELADSNRPATPAIFGDWREDHPGLQHKIVPSDLPAPFETDSAGNSPAEIRTPEGAKPKVPEGFDVQVFAEGFEQPRLMRTAPNGDIFIAESGADWIRVLRFPDGASKPQVSSIYAKNLSLPFGIAFYPEGPIQSGFTWRTPTQW